MVKAKGRKYPRKKGKEVPKEEPTEAVFRIDLATGNMRITDQKGDALPEDVDVTPEMLAQFAIVPENSKLLAVLFYATCNIKHGGCVLKIVNGRQVLIW